MIITISGDPGSGKSTVAKILEDKLSTKRYYIGGLRREMAKKRGLSLEEYNKLGETDPTTDTEVDEYIKEIAQKEKSAIIESRTAFHFVPNSKKIFLKVDPLVGAKRIFDHLQEDNERNEGNSLNSVQEVLESTKKRIESDNKRYQQYYGFDFQDLSQFDIVIDTSNKTPDQVVDEIRDKLE